MANANQPQTNLWGHSKFSKLAQASFLTALVVLTGACSSLPKPSKTVSGSAGSAVGQWRGKAALKNLKNGKGGTLDLDLLAQEPDRLRIEALGPMSIHVASVAAKENEVRISLTREKKFVIAAADRNALSRLVPVRVAPSDLLAILFDRPLEGSDATWKCDRSKDPQFICTAGKAKIERFKDEEGRRKFKFTAPDAEMDLVLSEAPV
ncbi:MAG: hypothetical protein EOP05_02920, partial [Proteobacteria bacterium]